MKLRIKYNVERITIDIDGNGTLQQLREKCLHLPPATSLWYFSLNGSEPITSSEKSTLSQLGLVGGDLLHIVEENDGGGGGNNDGGGLKSQLLNMGFPKVNIDKVVDTFGANTIENALELLNMLGESGASQSNALSCNKDINNKAEIPNQSASSEKMDIESSATATNQSTKSNPRDPVLANESKDSYIKPLFLADGITEQLTCLVDRVKDKSPTDHLFLVVHALIKETGLALKTTSKSNSMEEDTVELPDGWRNTSLGFYRLDYEYKGHVSGSVTGTVTGKSMVVTGVVDTDDAEAHQVKLNISEFVDVKPQTSCQCESIYKNLKKLSLKIKNDIANKMIEEMRKELSLEESVIGLNSLPEELKLRLVCYLNPQTICRLAQVTRNWNVLCGNNEIWRRLLFRDFGGQRSANVCYREYKERSIERREQQRRDEEIRKLVRPPLRPDFDIGMPDILYPQSQSHVPGMIGGRNDLYPADFPEFGRPRNDPLRVGPPINPNQPGRIPGARFDPYGPMPDDTDEFGRRPLHHPDVARRPRFGRGDGFGGGGGGFGFM